VGGTHRTTMFAAEPHIPVYLMMLWLPITLLVAVVYLVSYGIAYKRRGLIAAGVSLFAVLVGAGALLALLSLHSSMIPSASVSYGAPGTMVIAGTDGSSVKIDRGNLAVMTGWEPGLGIASVVVGKAAIFGLAILAGMILLPRLWRPQTGAEHRCGWGLGRFLLIVVVVMFAARVWTASQERAAQDGANLQKQQAQHDRREAERARRHGVVSASQAPADLQASIEQLWDQINRPKIDLHAGDHEGPATIAAGPANPEIKGTQPTTGAQAKIPAPPANSTAESLAHSAAALGQLLARVSTIASEVSDTAKFISRTLVAVDSPTESTPAAAPPPAAAKSPAPPQSDQVRKAVTNAKPVVAKSSGRGPNDAGALNERIGGDVPVNKPRPTWVDEPQKQVGNVLRQVVVAGPYATPEECYAKTDELLKIATDNYVKQFLGGMNEGRLLTTVQEGSPLVKITNFRSLALERMGIDLAYIRREIAKDEYLETVERSVGPMKNLSTLLEFSPDVERELRSRWNVLQRDARLSVIGLLSGSVLGVIGLAFGLLKIDTATKGYYSKRLFLGVPALLILAILIVSPLIAAIVGHASSYRP
jgi:hypothetical protein